MVGARMSGAATRIHRLQGTSSAGSGQSRPGHHPERRGSPCLSTAGQTRRRRHHPYAARPGLSPRRNENHVKSSISRQLVFWLAVPLMLLALCGALVHYFNSVAPGVISSDRRLPDATNALLAHVPVKDGPITLGAPPGRRPRWPVPASIRYAL